MIGETIGHYKILEKIGQGGMGEVYLAQDTTLDRKVALKFLPKKLQQETTARKRFLREAKSAAALDHPFICKIYEVGEVDNKSFISMEYVPGETLKDKLAGGPLALNDALEKATEVAEALEEAHKQGIVHRDLKPANIMLTSQGHVKVMDFGLAKRVSSVEGREEEITTALTQQGSTLGTVPYMSPEQVRGQEVDTRSDIFSFGVVLYEMLAGVNPFSKGGHMDTAKAVLADTAPPLTRYTEDIPILLQHTIKKMLAKEPDQRYQLIHEVRTDLGELSVTSGESEVSAEVPAAAPVRRSYFWPVLAGGVMVLVILALAWLWPFTPAPPEGAIDSIAILPLENLSNDPDLEYLSDGIADSVISSLAQIASLKVMSSRAVRRYKGTDVDPQVVAEELGVRAVVMGRILQVRDDLSINVELIDAQDDTQLWGGQYERELAEILDVKQAIAQEISEKLRLQLSGEEQKQLAKRGTQNPEAYQAYLKGQYYRNNRSDEERFEKAVGYFNEAIGLDPNYAQAYAGLADTYYVKTIVDFRTIDEVRPLETAAAQKALELDANLAEAHVALAQIKGMHDHDWSTAETEFKRALELNPNSAEAHHRYQMFLRIHRRFDEALAEAQKAQELDPLNRMYNSSIGETLLLRREYDEAIEQLQETLEIDPSYGLANSFLVRTYWVKGEREQAMAHLGKWQPDNPPRAFPWPYMALVSHVFSGNRVEAIQILEDSTTMFPWVKAMWYTELGETDQAIEVVKSAIDQGYPGMAYVNVWPELDPLRSDPRFQEQLRRMNLEP